MSWFLDDARASRAGHRAQPVPRDDRPRTTYGKLLDESRSVAITGRSITAVGRMGGVSHWTSAEDRITRDTVLVGVARAGVPGVHVSGGAR